MKINELLHGFSIFTNNEEQHLLDKLSNVAFLSEFSDREQVIIEGLIRKSLVIKIGMHNPQVVVNPKFI